VVDYAREALAPMSLVGLPRSGTYAVARAIHRDGEASGFVSVRSLVDSPRELAERIVLELEGDPAVEFVTLYVEGVDRQPRPVQELLLRLIDEGIRFRSRSIAVRVVAQTTADPRGRSRFASPVLAARLATLVVPVFPMEARRDELLAIVMEVAADLVARFGLGSRWLSPEGARNLADRDWPGDFEELEGTLARILAGARGSVVTLEDVLAAGDAGKTVLPARSPAASAPPPASPITSPPLEYLLMELAHELKNPMVTLKTFSGHLDRLLDDPETRGKFVHLAGEAIDRMDGFLEDLLAFSRFGEPRPQVLPLDALLARTLSPPERERFSGNGIPPGVVVVVDEEQAQFAFRALFRAFRKRLPPEAPIVYQWVPPAGLRFDSRAEPTGIALHNIMGQGNRDELSASLDFFVSRSLIERNRGRLVADRDETGLHVRLELPAAGAR
jgi:signal transduction histidine kinase